MVPFLHSFPISYYYYYYYIIIIISVVCHAFPGKRFPSHHWGPLARSPVTQAPAEAQPSQEALWYTEEGPRAGLRALSSPEAVGDFVGWGGR